MSLPTIWLSTTIGDICTKVTDGSHNPPKATDSGLPMLSAKNIHHGLIDFDEEHRLIPNDEFEVENKRTQIAKDDVLLTIVGALGRTAVVQSDIPRFTLQRSVAVLRPLIDPRYFRYCLESPSFQKQIVDNAKGTAQKGVYLKTLKSLEINIAPLAEQQLIADKLDNLLSQVESIKARLERILEILKELRQSVLAAAVSRKLTDLESSWEEKKLKDCFDCIDGDRGPNYPKKDDYLNEGYCLFLSTKNVREFGFDFKELVFISREKDLQLRKGKLERGDIVITTRGTLGYVASYDDSVPFDEIRINSGMLILRKKNKEFVNDFFKILIASPVFQRLISLRQTGSAQPQLPAGILKDFNLAFPCVEEQVKIVNKVKVIFTSIDLMEQQVQSALNRVNNLTQSILAKAFRGELTAEWRKANPDLISGENSVEALLKRIKAELESAKSATKRGRGKA